MTIEGLGNDIIEIERIRQGFEEHGERFLKRLFTEAEIKYCRSHKDPFPRFAGRFAAKEAIAKVMGTGLGENFNWHDVEILPDELGKPCVHLSDGLSKRTNGSNFLVSISHCKTFATAVAIKTGKTEACK